jgi:HEPN domain-containing protein
VSLQDWLESRWLIKHKTSHQEIADLLGMADRDLAQCRTPNLSPDWQLNIAYNAALQAATAALAAAGYRAARETHHYRVIQSLAHTIKADPVLVAQLDKFRKKRNISDYERAGAVSEQEAEEMFVLAKNLRNEVEKWLRSNYPKLL